MTYTKVDTPRMHTSNMCLVYIYGKSLYPHIEPSITTHTGVSYATINGASNYTDIDTGLTIKTVITNGSMSFEYEYSAPSSGAKTGSKMISLEVGSTGNNEYTADSVTYTIGLVCCTQPLDPYHAGNPRIPVSGISTTIGTGPVFSPVDDIYDQSSSISVAFTKSVSSFDGVPDTPGPYIGIVEGTYEPVPGFSATSKRPLNIAVHDTRLYTDQEYVLAVEDPTTVYADNSTIKIHEVDDAHGSVPFKENPGNGFYLSCTVTNTSAGSVDYIDQSGSTHTYDVECIDLGSIGSETPESSCKYYNSGSCMYSKDKCYYSRGILTTTDSSWELRHNNNVIATAKAPYNSEYAPSWGWFGAAVTGEAEIQHDGNPYTHLATYDSTTYKPVEGKCTKMPVHELLVYGYKDSYSKSFNVWGTYGGPGSSSPGIQVITYDVDTENYAKGLRTSAIYDSDSDILSNAGLITGAALLTHPLTGSYLDNAVAVDKTSVVSGYGTSSGPYGVAVPDTMLPSYDWAQFYLNRPRTSSLLPYGGNVKASIKNSNVLAKWCIASKLEQTSKYSGPSSPTLSTEEFRDSVACVDRRNDVGLLTEQTVSQNTRISGTITIPDISTSMTLYTNDNDILSSILSIGSVDVSHSVTIDCLDELVERSSVHAGFEFQKYIYFDDILYKRTNRWQEIGCGANSCDDIVWENDESPPKGYKVLCEWTMVLPPGGIEGYNPFDGIIVESTDRRNSNGYLIPFVNGDGTTIKRSVTMEDLWVWNEDHTEYTRKYDTIGDPAYLSPSTHRTLYNTQSTVQCRAVFTKDNKNSDKLTDLEFRITYENGDYADDGRPMYYVIDEEAITVVAPEDLVRTYSIDIEHTNKSYRSIECDCRDDTHDCTYTVWCDCNDPCYCGMLCTYTERTRYHIISEHAVTINLESGTITTSTDSFDASGSVYKDPADCVAEPDDGPAGSIVLCGITVNYCNTRRFVGTIINKAGTDYREECGTCGDNITSKCSVEVGDDLSPCVLISASIDYEFSYRPCRYPVTIGYSRDGYEFTYNYNHGDCICHIQSGNTGSYCLPSLIYDDIAEGYVRSSIHVTDRQKCNTTTDRFVLRPGGFLSLYFPSPGTVSSTFRGSMQQLDAGNYIYPPGESLDTGSKDITITISDDGVSNSDQSSSDSSESSVPIACYREGGEAARFSAQFGLLKYDQSMSDLSKVSYMAGVYPFESPSHKSGNYRDIVGSSKSQIIYDNGKIIVPKFTGSAYMQCEESYTHAKEGADALECRYPDAWYGCITKAEFDYSKSESKGWYSSDSYVISVDPASTVNPTIISLSIGLQDTAIDLMGDADNNNGVFYIDHNYYKLDWRQDIRGSSAFTKSELTVIWGSRPTYDETVNDGLDPEKDIILPIIEPGDTKIYMSKYRFESFCCPLEIKVRSTDVDCAESSYSSVLDLMDTLNCGVFDRGNTISKYSTEESGEDGSDCELMSTETHEIKAEFFDKRDSRSFIEELLVKGNHPIHAPRYITQMSGRNNNLIVLPEDIVIAKRK